MNSVLSKIDWLHVALTLLAVLGPLAIKAIKDRGYARISAVLEAVIRGVEDHYDATGDTSAKASIKDRATVEGVEDHLNPIVSRVTRVP